MKDMFSQRMAEKIAREGMEWGNDVALAYHGAAAAEMNSQWNFISPILSRHNVDLSETIDFACGYGRNALKLAEAGANKLTMVDVNQENIAFCQTHVVPLDPSKFTVVQNNGFDLSCLPSKNFTHLYSFDAMVHFDIELVLAYIAEFSRVLKPGGTAFIHHSNYTDGPGNDFRQNPHWRNFMSDLIFKHVSILNGFDMLEQINLNWGGYDNIDCITVMKLRNQNQ